MPRSDQLQKLILKSPGDPISPTEKDLLWRYRFYLTREAKALTKFLRCVDWTLEAEAKQAAELLEMWEAIGVVDALELLSSDFRHPSVRRYAVARLQQEDAGDLGLFLLQLVQALQYEAPGRELVLDHERGEGTDRIVADGDAVGYDESTLEGFLIKTGLETPTFGHYFSWYLLVECKDREKKVPRLAATSLPPPAARRFARARAARSRSRCWLVCGAPFT